MIPYLNYMSDETHGNTRWKDSLYQTQLGVPPMSDPPKDGAPHLKALRNAFWIRENPHGMFQEPARCSMGQSNDG